MALDAKAIKEEVLEKDMYESNARRVKGKSKNSMKRDILRRIF